MKCPARFLFCLLYKDYLRFHLQTRILCSITWSEYTLFYNWSGATMEHISPATGAVENDYLTYQQDGTQLRMMLDTPAWQNWLANASSFTFKSAEGSFTAHKARASNGRGGWYWYAYRRQHGHLSNV